MDTGNNFVSYRSQSYKALAAKGIAEKHIDHFRKKESPTKDEIYPKEQLENGTYIEIKQLLIPLLQQIIHRKILATQAQKNN